MDRDQIFNTIKDTISPFKFNQEVADVFDDMLVRSIPFYKEIHKLIIDMVDKYYLGEGKIYDFGCSTGTTIDLINRHLAGKTASYVGVDLSAPMIEKAQQKLNDVSNVELICGDMTQVEVSDAQVVILNYTLQFLAEEKRKEFLEKIYRGLRPGGLIILSEKIKSPHAPVQDLITELYYDFKKANGYSELEISQKREALENVLVPLTATGQIELLQSAGFAHSEMIFRWYTFASFIGIKHA